MLLGEEPRSKLDDQDYLSHEGCEGNEIAVESKGELWCVSPKNFSDFGQSYTPMMVTSTVSVHPSSTAVAYAKGTPDSGPVQTVAAESIVAIGRSL